MAGLAHGARADLRQAHLAQHRHRHLEALALLAQQCQRFERHIVKPQLQMRGAAQAHHRLVTTQREARQALVDHEQADAPVARSRRDQEEVRHGCIADEMFAAVEQPAAGRPYGAGRNALRVRSGTGLGDGDRAHPLPAHTGRQPACHLRALASQQRLVDVAKGAPHQDVAGVAKLFLAQHPVDRAQAPAAELLRYVQRVQAQRLGLLVNGHCGLWRQIALLLNLLLQGLQFVANESAHRIEQQALRVV